MIYLLGLLLVKAQMQMPPLNGQMPTVNNQMPPVTDTRCTTMLAHNCTACMRIDTPVGVDAFGMPVFRQDERCTECSPGFSLSATIPEGPTEWCHENSIPTTTTTEKIPDETTVEVKCSNCLRCKKGTCTRCLNDNEWTLVDGICKTKDTGSSLYERFQELSSKVKAAAVIILLLLVVLVTWSCWSAGMFALVGGRKTQPRSWNGGSSVKAFAVKQTSRGESFSAQGGRMGRHFKRRSKEVAYPVN